MNSKNIHYKIALLVSLLGVFFTNSFAQTHLKHVGSSTIGGFIQDTDNQYSNSNFTLDTELKSTGGKQTTQKEGKKNQFKLYGDIRLRAEQDWDSRRFDGNFRDDRFRLRYRLRFGFTYNWTNNISLGARLRSGVAESLQSPHNNFGHREFTGVPINLDKVFLSGKHDKYWWWAGKNSFPFWKQNELFWDDDVTPEGIAIGGSFDANGISIKPKAAYFITNTGNGNFDPKDPTNGMIDGQMIGGQLELGFKIKENKVTMASSYYALKNINNVPTTDFFYNGDRFKLDYSFIVSGLKIELKTKSPITIGFDHFTNLEDYEGVPDTLINPIYKDQNTGFVISAKIGKLSEKGDWLFGYYYARKEEYSVVSYYTEDDWIRLGNINRNRNTNYQGHEIRVAYAFDSRFNVVARAYFVEGLVTHDVAKESGNRFRLDFNMKFNKQVR
ncbi:putative porin [Saprospiraceae bacterium]|nr:putative porin [Saprospiraceae bacterium]